MPDAIECGTTRGGDYERIRGAEVPGDCRVSEYFRKHGEVENVLWIGGIEKNSGTEKDYKRNDWL